MLDAGDSLWSTLNNRLSVDMSYVASHGKWMKPQPELNGFEEVIIVCSYLFSDSDLSGKKLKKSKRHLRDIWRSAGAQGLLTVSSPRKAPLIKKVTSFETWSRNCRNYRHFVASA